MNAHGWTAAAVIAVSAVLWWRMPPWRVRTRWQVFAYAAVAVVGFVNLVTS